MQKLYTLLTAFILLGSTASYAQTTELFDYDTGGNLEGLSGGEGWNAAWATRKGNEQSSIAEGGIAARNVGVRSGSNHLAVSHVEGQPGIRAARLLDEPVTDDGQTYYLSWFQEADYADPASHGSVAQVMLTNDAGLGPGGPGGQLVRMGKIFGTERFGIDGSAGASGRIAGTDTRSGMFVVVVIHMSGDEGMDALSFFTAPNLTAESLDTAAADLTLMANLNNGFDALGYKVEGTAALNARLDELRFGDELADVLPEGLDPIAGRNADTFNEYETGATLDGLDEGLGWGGPWVTVSGDNPLIAEGGLQNFKLLGETSGNHVAAEYTNTQGDSRYYRPLNATFADDGSTYYFSYTSVSSYTDRAGQADFFMLIDSATYAPTGPDGQLLQIGKPLNSPFIGAGFGATSNFALTTAEAEDVNLMVVKLITSGNADPDTVMLYVNPDPTAAEPTEPDAMTLNGRLNGGFNAVGFKVTGLSPGNTMRWDDVYVGESFASVLPDDYTEVEPPRDAFVTETFNTYTAGDTLGGLNGGSGWAGPWMAMPSSDNSVIQAGGLLNNELAARTSENSLRMTADGMTERSVRFFASALDTTDNAGFWFSAHLGAGGGPAGTVGNLILVDTVGGFSQQVIIGKQFGNRNIFAVGDGQLGGASQTGRQFDGAGASFIVGHMTRDSGQWNLDLYVNPDPAAENLVEDSAQIINKGYRSGNFAGVALRIDGTGTELIWDVDDIYFGGSYTDVVPADLATVTEAPPGATERFDYMIGDSLVAQNGGTGWVGPWRRLSGGTGSGGVIQEEGVSSLNLLRATPGPSVRFDDYLRTVRPLAGTYGDNGREFWLGWWMDVEEGGPNVSNIVLADTATYMAGGPGGQLVQIGKGFGGTALQLVGGSSAPARFSADDGHFFVAHIVTDGSPAPDSVFVWIDPDLGTTPSRDSSHLRGAADLTNWNGIGIKFEGNEAPTTVTFDDILLGFTFAEVVPGDLVELEPPNATRAAYEPFSYEAGSELGGLEGGTGWGGPWEAISGTATVAEGNVSTPRTCPVDPARSLSIEQSGDPIVYRRPLFNPYGIEEDSVFYVSFAIDIANKDISNRAFVSIMGGENNLLSLGGIQGLGVLGAVPNDRFSRPETDVTISGEGTKWFVIRMDVNTRTGIAAARVFLDPPGDAIPADETAVFTFDNIAVGQQGITHLQVSAEGQGTVSMRVDDLRVGSSYRDISCQFGSDDPDLLAYEPFNYDAGESLIGLGGENAFWLGPWELASDIQDNTATILESSLDNDIQDEEGNKVELSLLTDGEQLRVDRRLATRMESDGRTYWLSYLQNTTDGATSNNVANITLNNTQQGGNNRQRLIIGRLFEQRLFGIAWPGGPSRRSDVIDEGLHWVVVRMQTNADETIPDTLTMWIDPPATSSVPDTNSAGFAVYMTTSRLKTGIDEIRMRVEGANADQAPYVTEIDEIKLATAWSSITGVETSVAPRPDDTFRLTTYPNPTTGRLTLEYRLERPGEVSIELLDFNGRRVAALSRRKQGSGAQRVTIDGAFDALPNGIYFLRLRQAGASTTRKLILYR